MLRYTSSANSSYFLLGAALLLLLFISVYRVTTRPSSRLPGPWVSKWTDLVLKYHWLRGRRSHYVHALHEKYGPVVRIAPDEVDLCDVATAKEVYNAKEVYLKSRYYTDLSGGLVENTFSTRNVDFHRRHRRLLAQPLSESALASMYPQVNAKVELTIQRIGEEMETRGAADVFKWFLFMATDVIGELTFGESFRMLEQGKKNQYAEDLEAVAASGAVRTAFPLAFQGFRRLRFLPIPPLDRAVRSVFSMLRYAEESLARHQRLLEDDPANARPTLFTKVFKAEEEDTLTFPEIRAEAQAFIVAGSDTTAVAMTYLVWSVCRHPEVKARLLEELRTLPKDFGDRHTRDLGYLNRVIDETLRLYGSAPSGWPRVVPPGGRELAGHWLDAGTVVCCQAYSLHRDPATFPKPEAFNPDRWAEPTREMRDALMPFGGGSRICLGRHLARIELRLATARFFLAFPGAKVSGLEGFSDEDMRMHLFFLLAPKGHRCLIEAD